MNTHKVYYKVVRESCVHAKIDPDELPYVPTFTNTLDKIQAIVKCLVGCF